MYKVSKQTSRDQTLPQGAFLHTAMADTMTEKQRKAFKSMKAPNKSIYANIHGVKLMGRMAKKTWGLAKRCPMFTKKTVDKKTGKKKTVRTNRLINNHAYKIVGSGAAQWVQAVLQREAKAFRVSHEAEVPQAPFLPTFSPGAVALFEQFLCAYAQDATRNAVSIRDGLNTCKRLNGGMMKLGYKATNERVFQDCMPVPRNIMICKPAKNVASKEKNAGEQNDDSKAKE